MAFTPKNWQFNDIITEGELNRMEQGIADAHQIGEQAQAVADTANQKADQNAADLAAHLNESVLLGNTPHGIVYEEGTFTPYFRPVSGEFQNIEYTDQYGYYVRRDNLVWVYGHLSVNGNTLNVGTASGHLRIAGLPYICRASGVMYGHIGEGPRSFRWNVDEQVIGIIYRSMPAMAEVGLYKKIRPGDNIVSPTLDEPINVVHLLKSSETYLNIVSFSFHYLI